MLAQEFGDICVSFFLCQRQGSLAISGFGVHINTLANKQFGYSLILLAVICRGAKPQVPLALTSASLATKSSAKSMGPK